MGNDIQIEIVMSSINDFFVNISEVKSGINDNSVI